MKVLIACILSLMVTVINVPSSGANTYDLDVKGEATGSMNGGIAILYTDSMNSVWTSSGSGVIDPFLTLQKKNTEKGFNTDAAPRIPRCEKGW